MLAKPQVVFFTSTKKVMIFQLVLLQVNSDKSCDFWILTMARFRNCLLTKYVPYLPAQLENHNSDHPTNHKSESGNQDWIWFFHSLRQVYNLPLPIWEAPLFYLLSSLERSVDFLNGPWIMFAIGSSFLRPTATLYFRTVWTASANWC